MAKDDLQFESFDQMAEATAAGLVQAAANYAFKLFRDKEFRRFAGFDILSEVEQDRIFNELLVAHVVLIMLLLEAPDLRVPKEFRDYLAALKAKIPKAHLESLRTAGVQAEHLETWEKLISLRYDEYVADSTKCALPPCRSGPRRKNWTWTVFQRFRCSSPSKPSPSDATTMSVGEHTGTTTCPAHTPDPVQIRREIEDSLEGQSHSSRQPDSGEVIRRKRGGKPEKIEYESDRLRSSVTRDIFRQNSSHSRFRGKREGEWPYRSLSSEQGLPD